MTNSKKLLIAGWVLFLFGMFVVLSLLNSAKVLMPFLSPPVVLVGIISLAIGFDLLMIGLQGITKKMLLITSLLLISGFTIKFILEIRS